jgi:hypothetical protein
MLATFQDQHLQAKWMPSNLWAEYCNTKHQLVDKIAVTAQEVNRLFKDRPRVQTMMEANCIVDNNTSLYYGFFTYRKMARTK